MGLPVRLFRRLVLALALALLSGVCVAEPAVSAQPVEAYQAHLVALRELVAACRTNAAACDPAKVGGDDRVPPQGQAPGFDVHWSWLWDTILKAKDPKSPDRDALLRDADARLADQAREAGIASGPAPAIQPDFQHARSDADRILAGSEFRKVTGSGLWDLLMAKFFAWLNRVFGGVSALGQRAPWIGPVIMYGFLLLAFSGLLVWVLRVLDRQRLAVRLESSAAVANWQEASRNWAQLAEAAAAHCDWREAVHALYWASVTELEGRRIWRQNNARTPREYLRLLSPDAPQHKPLRALTQLLERIWYGVAPARHEDYAAALAVYQQLRSA